MTHDFACDEEGIIGDCERGDDGDPVRIDILLIERVETEGFGRPRGFILASKEPALGWAFVLTLTGGLAFKRGGTGREDRGEGEKTGWSFGAVHRD
jgi:hypothetical protein